MTEARDVPAPEPVWFDAEDGYRLGGFVWHADRPAAADAGHPGGARSVVVVNAATSVRCRYYFRFAARVAAQGHDVVLYDYRGIGESRPPRLAGLRATWLDWGRLDCEAALRFALHRFPGKPLDVVAHSIGGFVVGLAPSNHTLRRVFTMGAQYAYWRDYAQRERLAMLAKWHVAMPALAALLGYVPARRLGWMEDTPRGVALAWSRSRARFEDTYRRGPLAVPRAARERLVSQFAQLRAPICAVSVTDDPFGTVPAIERLLGYFAASAERLHVRLAPRHIGADAIGHFAFFHRRFEHTLWPIALHWLATGALVPAFGDMLVSRRGADAPLAPSVSSGAACEDADAA
ncbi:alpha/beta fold hydrolase [Trinickia caryophylli]|uniref:Predicted alpha/beta hydrolase n=1 Tax=Trinickia caryophylli TaxID=28094 RepID=A0A1X7DWT2_TRICW|nr:alpha/beta fold hydrolase [Trinickia caryophylli]PMS14323.1 alpha/beta hydrolase [Trinickia caryophylli]TRX17921.1 alpha/beta fold hydrolase [Trinickia caryophylli]WQE11304.1 alpha/beta fold hydrolase [Trinickia caryophylli]SMF23031.1 Predicted alpha/beta hydrolase [Trinickia caryophylli]GLU32455.1 hypothetical protein Busp01_22970 [Trinickia caryophylli]